MHVPPLGFTATPIELAVDPDIDHGCVDEEGDGTCDECGRPCDEHPVATDDQQTDGEQANEAEVPFVAIAAVLDYETEDGRLIEPEGFTWHPPPLPLMYQDTNPMMGGHEGAFLIGRIEEVAVDDRRVFTRGMLDLNVIARHADPDRFVEGIRSQTARFVSIDLSDADVEYDVRSVDEDGWPVDVLRRFSNAVMNGATVTPFPAIPDAVIWLDGETEPAEAGATLPDAPEPTDEPEVIEGDGMPMPILASGGEVLPPAEVFTEPTFAEPTGWQLIDVDGWRVVQGHIALWGTCHIGHDGCVTAPTSQSDYAYFRTGATRVRCDCTEPDCDDVIEVATGLLTMGTGHADLRLDSAHALAHYDDTGTAVARVVAGEDAHGIWIKGPLLPHVTDEQADQVLASNPSGDWRRVAGALDLVAVLAVNVPGFPVPRPQARLVASAGGDSVQTALVAPVDPRTDSIAASGGRARALGTMSVPRAQWADLQARLRRVEAITDALHGQAADAIAASLR